MGLIKILEYGYGGTNNDKLYLKVSIPKGSYFSNFYVCTLDEVFSDNSVKKNDYHYAVMSLNSFVNNKNAFDSMFTYLGDYTDGNVYSIYELNIDFGYAFDNNNYGLGITVSKDNLYFITMLLDSSSVGTSYITSTECGCDNTVYTMVVYDDLHIKLEALSYAKFIECSCTVPEEFMDRLLLLKALELSLHTENYYKASWYWNKFYKNKNKGFVKNCGCNG